MRLSRRVHAAIETRLHAQTQNYIVEVATALNFVAGSSHYQHFGVCSPGIEFIHMESLGVIPPTAIQVFTL
jgi:hypothetical protein